MGCVWGAEVGSGRCAGEKGGKNVRKEDWQDFVEISRELLADRSVDRLSLVIERR